MQKQKVMSQMKGKDKIRELNEVKIGSFQKKNSQ